MQVSEERHQKVRRSPVWGLLAGVGLIGVIGLAVIAAAGGSGDTVLRAGRPVPAAPIMTFDGDTGDLRSAAEGKREILIVSPNCDICAAELTSRLEAAERLRSAGAPDELESTLLLIVRSMSIPRATFMSAFSRLQEMGLPAVLIEPEEARAMGVQRVPGFVRIGSDGRIETVSYPERA